MKKTIVIVALAFAALVASSGFAADSARARLDAFAKGVHSLSCSFEQTTRDARGVVKSTVRGTLALAAPRQFRWQTEAPDAQLIVADGARVWIYDPELEQVTVRRQSSEEAHSPLTVLTDLAQMDKEFKVAEIGRRDGLAWLRLTPRGEDAQFQYAELGFGDDGNLASMLFRDTLGGQSEIRFSDWKRNPVLDAATFDFKPPAGADVVGDDVEVPEVHPLGH